MRKRLLAIAGVLFAFTVMAVIIIIPTSQLPVKVVIDPVNDRAMWYTGQWTNTLPGFATNYTISFPNMVEQIGDGLVTNADFTNNLVPHLPGLPSFVLTNGSIVEITNNAALTNIGPVNFAGGFTNWGTTVHESVVSNAVSMTTGGPNTNLSSSLNVGDVTNGSTMEVAGLLTAYGGLTTVGANVTVVGGSVSANNVTTTNLYALTNTAPFAVVVGGGLHTVAVNKPWTNDLGGRADLEVFVTFTNNTSVWPVLAYTNTTSGESWTNTYTRAASETNTFTITIPDIGTNETGSFSNYSTVGTTVKINNAWWHVK